MNNAIDGKEGYFARNFRWLSPLLFGLVLVLAPGGMGAFAPEAVPPWMPPAGLVGAVGALFLAGLGAAFTDTTSARLLRLLVILIIVVAAGVRLLLF